MRGSGNTTKGTTKVKKYGFICSLIILMVLVCSTSANALQGGTRENSKPAPSKPSASSGGGRIRTTKPATRAGSLELIVITYQPGSFVFVDKQQKGTTNANGFFVVRGLKPGAYTVLVKKPNFNEEQRVIEIAPGKNAKAEFTLVPMPGSLGVSSVAGSTIEVSNSGTYPENIQGLSLAPGTYRVTISKVGYRTVTRDVAIKAGQLLNLGTIPLEPLPLDGLLAAISESINSKNYSRANTLAQAVLALKPDQPQANALLARSYYESGNYNESVKYVLKALSLGEIVTLNIKHRHGSLRKSLCNGQLSIGRDSIQFSSKEYRDEGFRVSYDKLHNLTLEDGMRISAKVAITKPNGKEEKKDYGFYSPIAQPAGTAISCSKCQPQMQAILSVIQNFKTKP